MNPYSAYVAVLVLVGLFTAGCQPMAGRTAGQELEEDRTITRAVKSQLAMLEPVGLTRIEVKTIASTVYLIGEVPTVQDKSQAEDIARHVTGVRRVVIHLTIRPATTS